ncbi:MAG: helix-turn-helix domain-containing protein [Vicinamibacterales bacterium]
MRTKRPKGQRPELATAAEAWKRRRTNLGLTQAELAELLGVKWNTVARYETAQHEIPEMAIRLLGYIERDAREKRRKER